MLTPSSNGKLVKIIIGNLMIVPPIMKKLISENGKELIEDVLAKMEMFTQKILTLNVRLGLITDATTKMENGVKITNFGQLRPLNSVKKDLMMKLG